MSKIENLLSRLQGVKKTGNNSWLARCCAHEDRSPSLSISEKDNGIILVHCFAGCSIDEITGAIGLEVKDLMPERLNFHRMKPLGLSVNPRDALSAHKSDLTVLLVMAKMMQRGEVLSESDSLLMAKLVGRLQLTINLIGGE